MQSNETPTSIVRKPRVTATRTQVGKTRIVVIGLGNLLLRDEGVGIHVTRYLKTSGRLPSSISIIEAGTPGLDILTLLEGYDRAIAIDAAKMGGKPGAVYKLSFRKDEDCGQHSGFTSFHDFDFPSALRTGWSAGLRLPPEVEVVGVEPLDCENYGLELTAAVKAAVPRAAQVVKTLVNVLAE